MAEDYPDVMLFGLGPLDPEFMRDVMEDIQQIVEKMVKSRAKRKPRTEIYTIQTPYRTVAITIAVL